MPIVYKLSHHNEGWDVLGFPDIDLLFYTKEPLKVPPYGSRVANSKHTDLWSADMHKVHEWSFWVTSDNWLGNLRQFCNFGVAIYAALAETITINLATRTLGGQDSVLITFRPQVAPVYNFGTTPLSAHHGVKFDTILSAIKAPVKDIGTLPGSNRHQWALPRAEGRLAHGGKLETGFTAGPQCIPGCTLSQNDAGPCLNPRDLRWCSNDVKSAMADFEKSLDDRCTETSAATLAKKWVTARPKVSHMQFSYHFQYQAAQLGNPLKDMQVEAAALPQVVKWSCALEARRNGVLLRFLTTNFHYSLCLPPYMIPAPPEAPPVPNDCLHYLPPYMIPDPYHPTARVHHIDQAQLNKLTPTAFRHNPMIHAKRTVCKEVRFLKTEGCS
ncbi:hypothetical protein RHOSPDRAFT_27446 [Rhodotorula sp. JG-1b]|nr:hypothetical protein RHOSPDRAFT_27446 [Rhodotorula sp. JG-1b]